MKSLFKDVNILEVKGAYCIGRRWRIGAQIGSGDNASALTICVGSNEGTVTLISNGMYFDPCTFARTRYTPPAMHTFRQKIFP